MSDIDELSVLAEATRYLFRSILLVRDVDLSAPTPCQGWELGGLLRHTHASLAEVSDVLTVPEFGGESGRAPWSAADTDPVDALRAAIVDLLLASPHTRRACFCAARQLTPTGGGRASRASVRRTAGGVGASNARRAASCALRPPTELLSTVAPPGARHPVVLASPAPPTASPGHDH